MWSIDHVLIVTLRSLEVFDWQSREGFATKCPTSVILDLKIKPTHNESGEFQMCLGIGAAINKGKYRDANLNGPWAIHVEPVALLHLAHKKDGRKPRVRNGEFKYSDGYLKLRLDAQTGRLLDLQFTNPELGGKNLLVARLEQGAFDKTMSTLHADAKDFKNLCDSNDKAGSFFLFTLAQIEKQPVVQETPKFASYCRIARQLQSNPLLARLWNRWRTSDDEVQSVNTAKDVGSPQFTIPSTDLEEVDSWTGFIANLLQVGPAIADAMFPRSSWPWTISRETCFRVFCRWRCDDSPYRYVNSLMVEDCLACLGMVTLALSAV